MTPVTAGEGHNEPYFYCGEPCDELAGDPSRWPLVFAQPDGTGIVRFHHVGCVVERLSPVTAGEWRPIETVPKDGTDIEADLDRLRDALKPLAEVGKRYGYSYGPDTMVRVRLHLLRALSSPTPEGDKP